MVGGADTHLIQEKTGFIDTMAIEAIFIDMQHFSCPTRALDWSLSPYVGLYFAVRENMDSDGALFMWNSVEYNAAMKERYGPDVLEIKAWDIAGFSDYDIVQLVFATRKNERLVRQQGTFTLSNKILKNYCDLIDEPTTWGHNGGLYKLVIPKNLKHEFLARLKTMNISASSLFPGLDGLGRSIQESLMIRKGWDVQTTAAK